MFFVKIKLVFTRNGAFCECYNYEINSFADIVLLSKKLREMWNKYNWNWATNEWMNKQKNEQMDGRTKKTLEVRSFIIIQNLLSALAQDWLLLS